MGVFLAKMGWRIIEVTQEDKLQLYLNNLLIKRQLGKIIIPLTDIDTLLINNYKIVITVQLINALMRQNINVIITNNKQEPSAYILPVNGHHMSLKILEKQIGWTQVYKGNCWKSIIQNKIYNQKALLDSIGLSNTLGSYINQVKQFDITNREGHCAKVYWHTLFSKHFIRDQKMYQSPLLNAMLNYGYTVLRGLFIRSIIKKGLDPRIAFFHKSFTNFFALASDLMEPFRPIVDTIVFKNQAINFFSIEVRDKLVAAMNIKVLINQKQYYLNNAIDMYVDQFVKGQLPLWIDICE